MGCMVFGFQLMRKIEKLTVIEMQASKKKASGECF